MTFEWADKKLCGFSEPVWRHGQVSQMLPYDDTVSGRERDVVHPRDLAMVEGPRPKHLSHHVNIDVTDVFPSVKFWTATCCASLAGHVKGVFFRRTNEQVSRIATRRVVALVANIFFNWIYSGVEKIGYSVAQADFVSRHSELAVPVTVPILRPWPAFFCRFSVYVRPEFFRSEVLERRYGSILKASHLISSYGQFWLEPRGVLEYPHGSIDFTCAEVLCK